MLQRLGIPHVGKFSFKKYLILCLSVWPRNQQLRNDIFEAGGNFLTTISVRCRNFFFSRMSRKPWPWPTLKRPNFSLKTNRCFSNGFMIDPRDPATDTNLFSRDDSAALRLGWYRNDLENDRFWMTIWFFGFKNEKSHSTSYISFLIKNSWSQWMDL